MDTVNRSSDFAIAAPSPGAELSLGTLVGALWRRKLIILAMAAVAAVVAYGVLKTLTPRYTAFGSLVIESQRLTIPELQGVVAESQLDLALIRS